MCLLLCLGTTTALIANAEETDNKIEELEQIGIYSTILDGSGTSSDPYLIKTAYDLINFSNNSSGLKGVGTYIAQVADIDFLDPSQLGTLWSDLNGDGEVSFDEIDYDMDGDFDDDDAKGFAPISTFKGTYWGYDIDNDAEHLYKIKNLYINRPTTDYVGFFSTTTGVSSIRNISLVNVDITGCNRVGPFVGEGKSAITNCFASGFVTGVNRVGGLVGSTDSSTGKGTIDLCGTDVIVYAEGNHSGGVVGYCSSQVQNSYSKGYTYGNNIVGGIVGTHYVNGLNKSVTGCYSSGAVIGKKVIGGLVGESKEDINSSYSSGYIELINSGSVGAIVGIPNSSTITNVVYDTQTTSQSSAGVGIADVAGDIVGLNSSDFSDISNYPAGFSSWNIDSSTDGRAYLSWETETASNPNAADNSEGLLSVDVSYIGTASSKGFRIANLDTATGIISFDGVDWNWGYAYSDDSSSGSSYSIVVDDYAERECLMQPFIVNSEGDKIYGDMVLVDTKYLLDIVTLQNSSTDQSKADIKGVVARGTDVVEYGFLHSTDLNDFTLDDVSTSDPVVVQTVTEALSSSDYLSVPTESSRTYLKEFEYSSLDARTSYYVRAYGKDLDGVIEYGDVVRFIKDSRDLSLQLDGSSALIVDAESSSSYINDWSDQFSIDLWIKPDVVTQREVIISNQDGVDGYSVTLESDYTVAISTPSGDQFRSIEMLENSTWHYVAIQYSSGELKITIDGVTDATNSFTLVKPSDETNFIIGSEIVAGSLSNQFSGKIDALRLWDCSIESWVDKLPYDNVEESDGAEIRLRGSKEVLSGLNWSNLKGSFEFNVKSTFESINGVVPTSYLKDGDLLDYPFYSESSSRHFNAIAVGDPKQSVDLSRVNWSFDATSSDWYSSLNWSSGSYPGEGISTAELSSFEDVTDGVIDPSYKYCEYTIINGVESEFKPNVNRSDTKVNVLVDNESKVGSYLVLSDDSKIEIVDRICKDLFKIEGVVVESGALFIVESGSVEIH